MDNQLSLRIRQVKQRLFDRYYFRMNDKQRRALYCVNGPLLVLAGAGSGKTTVLVKRIAHIIHFGNAYESNRIPPLTEEELALLETIAESADPQRDGPMLAGILKQFADDPAPPYSVLAITFTNKAAGEMKTRLEAELGESARDIWAGTFHSICVRILRQYIHLLGYQRDFVIYDTDDQKKLIQEAIKKMDLDDEVYTPKKVLRLISDSKNKLQSVEDFAHRAKGDHEREVCADLYAAYQKGLAAANALDFDDIISLTVTLLRNHREPADALKQRFRYVLVDEYQDTNHAQSILMNIIGSGHANVMVVGDDDQSIYKFRGAVIDNILSFDRMYPSAQTIRLEQNYRSTKTILDAANAVIAQNTKRKGKTLWCEGDAGEKIRIHRAENQEEEARFIAEQINAMVTSGKASYRDFAVLYRVNAASNVLETVLSKSGVPHRLLGGTRFYDRAEIKDIIAYLSVVNNPADSVRLKRIINLPRRGLGDTTLARLDGIAAEENASVFDLLSRVDSYSELRKSASALKEFYALISHLRRVAQEESLSNLFRAVIEKSGYRAMLEKMGHEGEEKKDNIDELISSAMAFEEKNPQGTLSDFLEEIALVADIDGYDQEADSVVLMTVHSAKGLEFPYVFLAAMEENIFPSGMSSHELEDIEEERRLAYVAITRAKKQLFITLTLSRTLYGSTKFNPPSRFLEEIPPQLCQSDLNVVTQRARPEDVYRSENRRYSESLPHYGGSVGAYGRQPLSERDRFSSRVGEQSRFPAGMKATPYPNAPKKPAASEVFAPGARVRHRMFGDGTVLSAKQMSGDVLYEIEFDQFGKKRIMGSYARLVAIG